MVRTRESSTASIAPENAGRVNILSSSVGAGALSWTARKAAVAAQAVTSTAVSRADQGVSPGRSISSVAAPSPSMSSRPPSQSVRRAAPAPESPVCRAAPPPEAPAPSVPGARGSTRTASAQAAAPSGRLTAKTARHPKVSARTPPKTGASSPAAVAKEPQAPMARSRSSPA